MVCCADAGDIALTAAVRTANPTRALRIAITPLWRRSAAARPRRILDVFDLVERDIDKLAADLLHPADIDRLHDVAGLRVDRHRTARAHPFQSLRRRDQGVAVGLAARLLQR